MEQRYLGRSGLRVSRLGLGTMTWGRDTDETEAGEQLRGLLEAGGNLIDVGTGYGAGACEEVLGKLLTSGVSRDELVICAKALLPIYRPGPSVSRRDLLRALDASLTRLGVDHLDLWATPGWNAQIPLDETLSALSAAVDAGKARYTALSNLSGWQAALASASSAGPGSPIAVQAEYSLLQRAPERELLPAAHHLGLGMIAWSPLGRGVLTGKYRTGTPGDSRGASSHLAAFVDPYLRAAHRRVVDAVLTAAQGLGCAPLEVALAWVRDRAGVSAVLAGARTAAQFRAALASEDVVLPEEIRQALDEVSMGRR